MTDVMTRLAIAAALALGACASDPPRLAPGASAESPKPIAVSLIKLTHDIPFREAQLAPDERQDADLAAFLGSGEERARDHVFVLAGSTSLDGERAGALVARLGLRGVSAAVIRDSGQPAGLLRVIVERYVASAPDCPDWSRIAWANFDNLTSTNFGCATAADLAAMVADPHDLIGGRALGPVVGDPATFAVERYGAGVSPVVGAGAGGASGSGVGSSMAGAQSGGAQPGATGP